MKPPQTPCTGICQTSMEFKLAMLDKRLQDIQKLVYTTNDSINCLSNSMEGLSDIILGFSNSISEREELGKRLQVVEANLSQNQRVPW